MKLKTKNWIYIMLYRFFGILSIVCLLVGVIAGGITGSCLLALTAGIAFAMFPFFACYACASRSVDIENQMK